MMRRIKVILLIWLFPALSFANVGNDLQNFFDRLGFESNVTPGGAYSGQRAGYYTGGQVFARNQVRQASLATTQMPGVRAGCGGIDLFTGGFSFINAKELEQMGRNIINNAAAFSFQLAMKTISPQIETTMSQLQDWANKVNAMNINSCEAGAALTGVWARGEVAQQHVCQALSSGTKFADWAASRHGCGAGGGRYHTLRQLRNDPKWQDYIALDSNIAWEAIKKNRFLYQHQAVAELFMSLVGTIVIRDQGDAPPIQQVFVSLAQDRNLLQALLRGGSATIYQCDHRTNCLQVTTQQVTIPPAQALRTQVLNLLNALTEKIMSDEALTEREIGFINATSIPIQKILTVQLAATHGTILSDVETLADTIGMDIVNQYLQENIQLVRFAARQLQLDDELMEDFYTHVNDALAHIAALKREAHQDTMLALQLIERSRYLEKMLAGTLSSDLSQSWTWSQGLGQ